MRPPFRLPPNMGASLPEVIIAVGLSVFVVGGAALMLTRLSAGMNHTGWNQDAQSLRSSIRRHADCAQTMSAAVCDGSTPLKILRTNGTVLVDTPPNNMFGRLTVQATCAAGSLVVVAKHPEALDPLTKSLLTFSVIDQQERLCGLSPASMPPLYSSNTMLVDQGTACGPSQEIYAVRSTCPAGYQLLGGAPLCNFPAAAGVYSGGWVLSSFPVPNTQSWSATCCAFTFAGYGGAIVQPSTAICYRLNRSGKLDNE